jgi:hypothetical protein
MPAFNAKHGVLTLRQLKNDLYFSVHPQTSAINQMESYEYNRLNPYHVVLKKHHVPEVLLNDIPILPTTRPDEWVKGIAMKFGTCPPKSKCRPKKFIAHGKFIRPAEIRSHLDGCGRKDWEVGNLKVLFKALNKE